jgi:transcriptional enhancer factor
MALFCTAPPWSPASGIKSHRVQVRVWRPCLRQHLTTFADPTQYTIVQEVVKGGWSSPVTMFSAVYKFTYRSKENECLHSPALSSTPSDQSSEDTKTPRSMQPSAILDSLLPLDPAFFIDFEDFDTYFDFNSLDVKPNWESGLSFEYPTSEYESFQTCGSQDVFERLSVSPIQVEAYLPTDLYNYASSLIFLMSSFVC